MIELEIDRITSEISDHIKTEIENYLGSEAADLHHELFNTDYWIIGTWEAKQWLGSDEMDIIGMIQQYEQDNFGELYTDLSDPEKVVNMFAYIKGEQILYEAAAAADVDLDGKLTAQMVQAIKWELPA